MYHLIIIKFLKLLPLHEEACKILCECVKVRGYAIVSTRNTKAHLVYEKTKPFSLIQMALIMVRFATNGGYVLHVS